MNKDLLPVSDFLFSKNVFFVNIITLARENERFFSNILK